MGNRSTDRLVAALEAAGAPAALIDKARADLFHDFRSESATPILDLVLACEAAGLHDVANAARNGDFDATREESEEWMKGRDGQETFAKLVSGE